MRKFIVSIDAGTTSNRSILFDLKKLPLMLGMINAIVEDKKLELDW